MSFEDQKVQLKRSLHRHRDLKPRFSPTAIFTDPSPTGGETAAVPNDPTPPPPAEPVPSPTPTPTPTPSPSPPPSPQTTPSPTPSAPTPTPATPGSSQSTSSSSSTTSSQSTTSSSSSTTPPAVSSPPPTIANSAQITPAFVSSSRSLPAAGTGSVLTVVSSDSSSSSTSSPDSTNTSGGMSTAGIIGVAAAAVVGIAVVAGIVMFVLRKYQRRSEADAAGFDDSSFRRQSTILPDEVPSPLYRGNSGGGGRPRPPTMIERHYLNAAGNGAQQQMGNQNTGYYDQQNAYPNHGGYAGYQQPSFAPGQVMHNAPAGHYTTYNPMSQSPVTSPVMTPTYPSAYDADGNLVRQPSVGSVLTRANSSGPHAAYNGPNEAEYADMSRASVTPYQAEQYAAISRQLNVEPPVPLQPVPEHGQGIERDAVSPFSDPDMPLPEPSRPLSDELFVPPSLAAPDSAKMRVMSVPPSLPEITLQQRPFSNVDSYQFPVSAHPSPSPLATSFVLPSPQRTEYPILSPAHGHVANLEAPAPAHYAVQQAARAAVEPAAQRPQSMYDNEDAYA